MFLVQQKNQSCSITIKKIIGEALSGTSSIQEGSAAAIVRKASTNSEESKKKLGNEFVQKKAEKCLSSSSFLQVE